MSEINVVAVTDWGILQLTAFAFPNMIDLFPNCGIGDW
jgi:hypothetical protein